MTENKEYDIAALAATVEEQKAAIVKMSEIISAYEQKMVDYEKKFTAASAPAPAAEKKEQEINPQDAAYEAVLRDLGLRVKEA